MCDDHHDVPDHPALLREGDHGLTRRAALRHLGIGGAGLGAAGLLAGGLRGAHTLLAPQEAYAASCTLFPEVTEGPYQLDLYRIRKTITEGRSGLRLDLRIRVIDSSTCKPVRNAAVDIWHADAAGRYSGFAAEGTSGQTWMRGIQLTDSTGLATFRTIYPGWYQGRATHIHVQVLTGGKAGSRYTGGTTRHTGQLFFPDTTTDRVARLSPYRARTVTRTRNSQDGIYGQAGAGTILKLKRRSSSSIRSGFTGSITMGIDA